MLHLYKPCMCYIIYIYMYVTMDDCVTRTIVSVKPGVLYVLMTTQQLPIIQFLTGRTRVVPMRNQAL